MFAKNKLKPFALQKICKLMIIFMTKMCKCANNNTLNIYCNK